MPSRSFKRDLTGRPLRYRTPSPPRDAFESISPTYSRIESSVVDKSGNQWFTNRTQSHGRKHSDARVGANRAEVFQGARVQGTMDAFASIALATGSNAAPRRSSQTDHAVRPIDSAFVSSDDPIERPAKRARSEKLPSPELRRSSASRGARPATSYEQSPDTRVLEAELLLNFAQEARFTVPAKYSHPKRDHRTPPELATFSRSITGLTRENGIDNTLHGSPTGPAACDTPDKALELGKAREGFRTAEAPIVFAKSTEPSNRSDALVSQLHLPKTTLETDTSKIVGILDDVVDSVQRTKAVVGEKNQFPQYSIQVETPHTTEGSMVDDVSKTIGTEHKLHQIERPTNTGSTAVITQERGEPNPLQYGAYPETGDARGDHDFESCIEKGDSGSLHASIVDTTGSLVPEQDHLGTAGHVSTHNAEASGSQLVVPAVCAACNFSRSTADGDIDSSSTSWICCDACKAWFHFACAGFKTEREVRAVDKYRCRKCRLTHGATTFVRKSARAHSAIDYAGLHQGVIKTSDETPEHHYIKPIKEGSIAFQPETFARIRPELVTAEYFEKGYGWKEPIVVPAAWNPRPHDDLTGSTRDHSPLADKRCTQKPSGEPTPDEWNFADLESEFVPDHGQDALDMVMPKGLTVRAVAELYGPEEKVEVIDVKSQNGEGKKWNMRRWADYYESKGDKIVRNVISLEVSQSKLGRLIRRPQVVRDLDLQDSVWPLDLQAKGEIPRVQFYCLMSVADCFTDFHIDFGGSSVFYHILKGKKTFFFIPPKEKHLKKYEEWCLSPAQNWTFLGDQTKECYRVDLSEGDTMFIPAGWIHAVWTPEDSLVIGGNFLTRLNYGMQLRISQIEKATGVARKFRYPHFQKIHWYTAFRYLEEDPLPNIVYKLLQEGEIFYREKPAYHEFDDWGENSQSGLGNYHARYYSQAELEGLPDLTRYLLRTALIDLGSITEGITQETRNAVKRSIPRSHGEPLEIVKRFAAWCAWKRGNEPIPSWAYPDAIPEPESAGKLSTAAQKKLDREVALQAPRRQSARRQSQMSSMNGGTAASYEDTQVPDISTMSAPNGAEIGAEPTTPTKRRLSDSSVNMQADSSSNLPKKRRTTSSTGSTSHRKVACESCRKRRRACKHKDTKDVLYPGSHMPSTAIDANPQMPVPQIDALIDLDAHAGADSVEDNNQTSVSIELDTADTQHDDPLPDEVQAADADDSNYLLKSPDEIASTPKMLTHLSGAGLLRLEHRIAGGPVNGLSVLSLNAPHSRGRTKACNECRKSKRRCIHDEYGNEDPVKAREAAIPRPAAGNKRRRVDSDGNEIPHTKKTRKSSDAAHIQDPLDLSMLTKTPSQQAPVANMGGAPTAVMFQPSPESETRPQDHSGMMLSALDQIEAVAGPDIPIDPALESTQVFRHQQSTADPPAPAARSSTTLTEKAPQDFQEQIAEDPSKEIQNVPSPTPSMRDYPVDPALEQMSSSFSVPAASLVSPPASAHADNGRTPPSPSASSSRQSSHLPKQMQRYTPESGPRRDSSSSIDDLPPMANGERADSALSETLATGKDTSPLTTISSTGDDERKAETRRKSRGSAENMADEESLKLIKELQAQDYGLRKRGRV